MLSSTNFDPSKIIPYGEQLLQFKKMFDDLLQGKDLQAEIRFRIYWASCPYPEYFLDSLRDYYTDQENYDNDFILDNETYDKKYLIFK